MAGKTKGRRHIKKIIIKQLESDFNFSRLEYKSLTKPGKGKSKLFGLIAASVVYMLCFGVAYFGWSNGVVPDVTFAKTVWVIMVPASVIGSVVWLIADSRFEYPIRMAMAQYVAELEVDGGKLWRYGPVLETFKIKGMDVPYLASRSQEGEGGKIDPQDYAIIVHRLYAEIASDNVTITGEMSRQLENNLLPE
ncbi:hypothetical protein MNBD_GAMMA16-737 [hydrothermal vent metagenome]|uniref:Uncharacterized protein n=1 Tax=hydrothermal vent metagenome TaxID=652676 RepID=A0A3B0ZTY4_9ZZZZ